MTLLWHLFVTFCNLLPWVAIALMAALALRKRKQSTPLMLQAGGAAAMFILGLGQWVIEALVYWMFGYGAAYSATSTIFSFLLFIALATFALGYCMDHLASRKPVDVTATPA